MYFKDKTNTSIDEEFDNKKFNFQKLKLPLIILLVIILLLVAIILIPKKEKINYFLTLEGNKLITIYKDSEFLDPGYTAFDNLGNNLIDSVIINSNLDTSKTGDYQITYSLNDITLTRYVSVIDTPEGITSIYLKGELNIYLDLGEEYKEPGYIVIDSLDNTLTDQVQIKSDLNINKKGTYRIIYSVTNSTGITTQAKRTIIVTDSEITLSLNNQEYTNKEVTINIHINDIYFDYLLLPDNNQTKSKDYSYKVSNNGTYKFISYNKKGTAKESSITVSNIDNVNPTGSCSGSYSNGISTINITASDNVGISKYSIDGTNYTSNKITIKKELTSVKITIYDKAGNTFNTSCTLEDKNVYGNIANINPSKPPIQKTNNISINYYTSSRGKSFAYWFYAPDKITSNLPIIIHINGLGELGNDYNRGTSSAVVYGPIHEVLQSGYTYNALIIHPQVPDNDEYVYGITADIIELTNKIADEFQANKNKISIMGFSHGCYGVKTIVSQNPYYFSAAVPIGCDMKGAASSFIYTPVWTFVGSGDGVNSMPAFVKEVNNLGGNAKHTKVNGPHNILADPYDILKNTEYNVIDWMISQTRK